MALLLGLFVASASAIVLVRLSLDVSLSEQSGDVIYPLALGTFVVSLVVVFATVISSDTMTVIRPSRRTFKARFHD